jgi:hypothetical protein
VAVMGIFCFKILLRNTLLWSRFTVETKVIHPHFILYFQGKGTLYPLNMGLDGPQSRFERWEKKEISYPYRKPNPAFVHSFFHSFTHQWFYSRLLGPIVFLSIVIFFTQTAGHLGRVVSPRQGRHLHAEQHKHRKNTYTHETSMP